MRYSFCDLFFLFVFYLESALSLSFFVHGSQPWVYDTAVGSGSFVEGFFASPTPKSGVHGAGL